MSELVIKGYLKEFAERITKIEETQKKNSRTQDDEQRKEEEKAKAAFEHNKEFETFTASFKAKMELMQKALEKTQRVDDYLATMGGITKEEPSQLPPKFSILEADKFVEVGDPKQHLRQYLNFVKIKGLNEEQVLRAFSLSLAKSTSNWYYTLNVGQTKNLGVLVKFFIDQFSYNTMIDVTLSDVETTHQRENETFSEFLVQ
jgi:hypothetical protein